jgi:diaminohydroxyphosphoribosylaminopyrimidine deaminase / 5-amino-6-(5-phosphoribosylamino)uracil reductase
MKPNDLVFMQRALTLAAKGKGFVSPNPCVGCVIVKNGAVVAEGFHAFFGGPHAEIAALREAGPRARGADMYLTLEPCVHWGKTGPCAPEVIRAGIKRVHIAMLDPFPKVSGRGAAALRRAGIRVTIGLEKDAAAHLNRSFVTWVRKRRPHVVYKAAMTLDGKTSTSAGQSRWISGPPARQLVHRLRAESDAVLVGAQTAAADNPALTSHGAGREPLRIVVDPRLRLSPDLQVFDVEAAPTAVVTGKSAAPARVRRLQKKGVRIVQVRESGGRLDLKAALKEIAKMNVGQLLLEGGGETAWHFVRDGLVDEALVFVAPVLIGGRGAPSPVGGPGFASLAAGRRLRFLSTSRVGGDLMIHALVERGRKA